MPRGNRTGPNWEGPMTGRGLGYCAGHDAPGYTYPGPGPGGVRRGFRGVGYMTRARIRGGGYGTYGPKLGRWAPGVQGVPGPYAAPPTPDEELKWLEGDLELLGRELKATEERINELKEKGEE